VPEGGVGGHPVERNGTARRCTVAGASHADLRP
jgi:hypothetical protein